MTPQPTSALHLGSGEPVLLLHGFMMSHHCFDDVARDLARDYEVYAPTMLGHWGGERGKLGRFSIEAAADDVERQMDKLGWQTCHVVGNSLGGWVGLELCARGRARSLTAIAPGGGWKKGSLAQWIAGFKFAVIGFFALSGFLLGEFAARTRAFQVLFLHVISRDVWKVSRVQAADFLRAATHCRAHVGMIIYGLGGGFRRAWSDVQCPVTIVLCEHDRVLPPRRYSPMFFEKLPQKPLRIDLPTGHVPMLEAHELTTTTITADLRRHGAAPRG